MRILHTADWHLGKKLNGFNRHEEQVAVLNEICQIADQENPDLILIAGDCFDNANPSSESTELFYKTLRRLSAFGRRAVVAIAGNHDSPERIAAPDPLARTSGIILVGMPDAEVPLFESENGVKTLRSEPGFFELQLPGVPFPVRILATPFANEQRLKRYLGPADQAGELRLLLQEKWKQLADKYADQKGVNLLTTHLYVVPEQGPVEPEGDGERSIAGLGGADAIFTSCIPPQIQYAALGHIHKHWKVASKPCPVVYSSSPLSYSFSEAGQTKYVVLIEAEPGQPVDYKTITLKEGKPVIRITCESVDEALQWLSAHEQALVELTIKTDTYLSATDTRRLHEAHSGILDVIPLIYSDNLSAESSHRFADLEMSKEDIFKGFFRFKKGIDPSEELLSLFHEILESENQDQA